MALSELAAIEAAYQVLQPLDAASRRRAMQWLTDALAENRPLSQLNGNAREAEQSDAAPRRTRSVSAATAARRTTKATPAPKRRGRKPGGAAAARKGERAYRRMPSPEEVMKAYQKVGTVSGLAEHFDVPVYTVTSWARRLRSQGYAIGRVA